MELLYMYAKTMMLGICFLTVIAQSGCSLIQSKWREAGANSKSLAASTAKITPWLANSVTITLTDNPVSLPEVLQEPQVAQFRKLTSVVVTAVEAKVIPDRYLKDNCVVLLRGNDHWYFLEPSSLLEFYVGRIPVRPGDKIFTLPFQSCKFVVPRPVSNFEYVLIEPGKAPESIPVNIADPSETKYNINDINSFGSPSNGWTATVVTRVEGTRMHHLVLPAIFDKTSPLKDPLADAMTPLRDFVLGAEGLYVGCFFQPGDVVEKVNFSQLLTRF